MESIPGTWKHRLSTGDEAGGKESASQRTGKSMKWAPEVKDGNQAESSVAARVDGGGAQSWTLRVLDWAIKAEAPLAVGRRPAPGRGQGRVTQDQARQQLG